MSAADKEFNHAAKRQDPSVFDYENEVKQVWHDFPETKDSVVFLDICADQPLVYPDESETKKIQIKALGENADLLYFINNEKNSFCMSHGSARYIALYTEKHSHAMLAETAQAQQETMFVFDHELGHAVIPNGSGISNDPNLKECIADSYATIRHFQRYGTKSTAIDSIVANRAFDYIFRETSYGLAHFTSAVTEQILARRHDIDWDSLNPQETTRLARRFALEYIKHPFLRKIHDLDFAPLHGTAEAIDRGDVAPLEKLAAIVLSTESPDIFKHGSDALKIRINEKAMGAILCGEYWDNVREKLAEKQKCFDTGDKLLFGVSTENHKVLSKKPKKHYKAKSPKIMAK